MGLVGNIPSTIGNLANLEFLGLYMNCLIGEVPSGIYQLPNLTDLHLQFNRLSGVIPESICDIQTIGVEDNKFCAPYPNCLNVGYQDCTQSGQEEDYGTEYDQDYECQNSICPYWGGDWVDGQCWCYDYFGALCNPSGGWDCWWEDIPSETEDERRCRCD